MSMKDVLELVLEQLKLIDNSYRTTHPEFQDADNVAKKEIEYLIKNITNHLSEYNAQNVEPDKLKVFYNGKNVNFDEYLTGVLSNIIKLLTVKVETGTFFFPKTEIKTSPFAVPIRLVEKTIIEELKRLEEAEAKFQEDRKKLQEEQERDKQQKQLEDEQKKLKEAEAKFQEDRKKFQEEQERYQQQRQLEDERREVDYEKSKLELVRILGEEKQQFLQKEKSQSKSLHMLTDEVKNLIQNQEINNLKVSKLEKELADQTQSYKALIHEFMKFIEGLPEKFKAEGGEKLKGLAVSLDNKNGKVLHFSATYEAPPQTFQQEAEEPNSAIKKKYLKYLPNLTLSVDDKELWKNEPYESAKLDLWDGMSLRHALVATFLYRYYLFLSGEGKFLSSEGKTYSNREQEYKDEYKLDKDEDLNIAGYVSLYIFYLFISVDKSLTEMYKDSLNPLPRLEEELMKKNSLPRLSSKINRITTIISDETLSDTLLALDQDKSEFQHVGKRVVRFFSRSVLRNKGLADVGYDMYKNNKLEIDKLPTLMKKLLKIEESKKTTDPSVVTSL